VVSRYLRRPYEPPKHREDVEAIQWDGTDTGIVGLRNWAGDRRWKDPASLIVALMHTVTLETWVVVRTDHALAAWDRLEPWGWLIEVIPDEHPAYLDVYSDETFRQCYEVPG